MIRASDGAVRVEKIRESCCAPILRWAGSKKRLLPHISPYLDVNFSSYIEPFAGSASLFFTEISARSVLADSNFDLINFYLHLSRNPEVLYEEFISIIRSEANYYKIRNDIIEEKDLLKRSIYFLYLNRNCFNGIYRTNRKGAFNVPFSDKRVARYPSKSAFDKAAAKLQDVTLYCSDFETVVRKEARSGDLIYFDPPYFSSEKRIFTEYGIKEFGPSDFERLMVLCNDLTDMGVKVMLSFEGGDNVAGRLRGFNRINIAARRTIASATKARRRIEESLFLNFASIG
ncbi:MAG: Dam family site-specific DNA-(adenine-N6)-methyltransferase [Methylobacterium mesophilicum]|nr:Dam family site-specific DNA-(adenine-N6)-methyltransferase [Methylobacterium mesophilicum]